MAKNGTYHNAINSEIKLRKLQYCINTKTPFRCFYCYIHLKFEEATIDHVIPVCKGGNKSAWRNTVVCCKECNALKKEDCDWW